MSFARPQTLELFYIDGRPDGMLTATVFNWTGHVLMAPRTHISEALARSEAGYTGVYILLGEVDGGVRCYIGQGEDIGHRIKSHDTSKDWWTSVVFVVSNGNKLNRAHAQYLEARLIEIARSIGKSDLDNGTSPSRPSLSEADGANMEAFLEYLVMVLPALRIDVFLESRRSVRQPALPSEDRIAVEEPRFELRTPKHGVDGKARLEGGDFIVEQGSVSRASWKESSQHIYRRLFEELVRSGVTAPHGDAHRIFTTDYAFKSPSAAAAVLNGRASNGQETWRLAGSSVTYREWEAAKVGADENDTEVVKG